MNTNVTRAIGAVLLLGITWGFGYFIGADRSPAGDRGYVNLESATPFPDLETNRSSEKLSATAIGRVIDGKSDFRRQVSLHQYADSLDAAAMPGAINEAMQLPLKYRNAALSVLFARWAELDPAAAAKYANLLPKSANPNALRYAAVTAWAEKDFSSALAWAQSLEKDEAKSDALKVLAVALAKSDPAAAIKLIKENVPARELGNAYENVFSIWAENDFAGALAAAQGITDLDVRSRALRASLSKRIETDPREVLEIVRSLKLTELRWSIGSNAIRRWLERDMAAARDYVLKLPASEMRGMQIREVAQQMAVRDPSEALAWVNQIPEGDREEGMESLFSTWASKDSIAAMEAARGLPEGRLRDKAIGQLVASLTDNDRTAAISLLQELPAGSGRDNALNQLASRWARVEPEKAIEWYMENTADGQRNGLFQIMGEWSRNDPEEALRWANSLPEGQQKGSLIGQAISQLTRNDPALAAEEIKKLPIETQRNAVQNFMASWGYRDPQAAAAWAVTLRDETSQSNAFGAIASQWGGRDPVAAAQWIEKLPAGPGRDAAVTSYSFTASKTDPEGAVAWALTIQNPDKNRSAVRNVYATWVRRDPASAGNWLQSARNVPPELRTELQGMQASIPKR